MTDYIHTSNPSSDDIAPVLVQLHNGKLNLNDFESFITFKNLDLDFVNSQK